MKTLLALILSASLVAVAGESSAPTTLVLKHNGTTIRLFTLPCTNDLIVTKIKPEYLPRLRAAEGDFVMSGGRPNEVHGGCWMPADDVVVTVWDDGDSFNIPAQLFQPEGI